MNIRKKSMASERTICIDTNLLIDILGGRPRSDKVREIISANYTCVSPHSVVTAYYHTKKYGEFDNQTFQEYVDQFKILTISAKTLSIAYDLAGKSNDLEDAIQIAACKQAKIETFVTADKEIAKLYCNELNIELVE